MKMIKFFLLSFFVIYFLTSCDFFTVLKENEFAEITGRGNANLKELNVQNCVISPSFSKDVLSYDSYVPYAVKRRDSGGKVKRSPPRKENP